MIKAYLLWKIYLFIYILHKTVYDCIIKMKSKATHGTSGLSVAKMHLLMSYFD